MTTDLDTIRLAIEDGDISGARTLLREALRNPTAETYYLASLVALNNTQRNDFLHKALELDAFHQQAADALAVTHRDPGGSERKARSQSRTWLLPLLLLGFSIILTLVAGWLMYLGGQIDDSDMLFFLVWASLIILSSITLIRYLRRRLYVSRTTVQIDLAALWLPFALLSLFRTYVIWGFPFLQFLSEVVFSLSPWLAFAIFAAMSVDTAGQSASLTPYPWKRLLRLVAMGAGLAITAGLLGGELGVVGELIYSDTTLFASLFVVEVLSFFLLLNYLRNFWHDAVGRYELELAALWLAYYPVMYAIWANRLLDEDMLILGVAFWLVPAIVGLVVLYLGKPQPQVKVGLKDQNQASG